MTEKYKKYLKSDKWKKIKETILDRDCHKCVICGVGLSNRNVNIHHLNYENIYDEKREDLISLCNDCHEDIHKSKMTFNSYLKKIKEIKKKEKKIPMYILMESNNIIKTNKFDIKKIERAVESGRCLFVEIDNNLINVRFIKEVIEEYDLKELLEDIEDGVEKVRFV
jgi:NAD-dependent SIR2 family protein deacetylase